MRTYDEMLEEIETADDGAGPDPIATYTGPGLAELAAAIEAQSEAEQAVTTAVEYARERGATWQAIGDLLGITRQGALKRYSHGHHAGSAAASHSSRCAMGTRATRP